MHLFEVEHRHDRVPGAIVCLLGSVVGAHSALCVGRLPDGTAFGQQPIAHPRESVHDCAQRGVEVSGAVWIALDQAIKREKWHLVGETSDADVSIQIGEVVYRPGGSDCFPSDRPEVHDASTIDQTMQIPFARAVTRRGGPQGSDRAVSPNVDVRHRCVWTHSASALDHGQECAHGCLDEGALLVAIQCHHPDRLTACTDGLPHRGTVREPSPCAVRINVGVQKQVERVCRWNTPNPPWRVSRRGVDHDRAVATVIRQIDRKYGRLSVAREDRFRHGNAFAKRRQLARSGGGERAPCLDGPAMEPSGMVTAHPGDHREMIVCKPPRGACPCPWASAAPRHHPRIRRAVAASSSRDRNQGGRCRRIEGAA